LEHKMLRLSSSYLRFYNLTSSPYFLPFSSSNINDRNSSPTEEQEEQEDEEEQEERLEDIFPNNFEACS
jgi:hypothetical protein